jgi:hypothetical protein
MALGNITLRSTSSSSVVNLKANVDASIDIVNRPLTHEEVDLNFLEIGESVKANLISNYTTSDLAEGTRLYYTDARVGTYLSGTAKFSDISNIDSATASDDRFHIYYDHSTTSLKFGQMTNTDYLPEGSTNLYYTDARWDTRLSAKTTSNLAEGTNLYYTDARWDTRLGTKSTTDLTEGTNLYYTTARANTDIDARVATTSINVLSDVDTTGVANNKILKHNGTNWIISDLVTSTLTGLTDTTLTAPSNGEVLKYNGSAWVNAADTDTDFDGDLKATTLTSSTGDINVATYTDRNVILDLNANASIVANANTAVGDVISSAYLNTATDINAAINMSDFTIKGDLLRGLNILNNSNNANVTNVGVNLSNYHYNQDGYSSFNISLFDDTHSLHDSYMTASQNAWQWQFKPTNTAEDATGETRVAIFAGDTRGKIIHDNRAYDNKRRYSVPLTDAEAYGYIDTEHRGKNFTITATDNIKLMPAGMTEVGLGIAGFPAVTQPRLTHYAQASSSTGADNTKSHYADGYHQKITLSENVDADQRKQGIQLDTEFDLAGYTFGADNSTSVYRHLGNFDWVRPINSGSATTFSGVTGRNTTTYIDGTQNLTGEKLIGLRTQAYIEDASSTVTNLMGLHVSTAVWAGTATNKYSIYAPESDDKAYFAGQIITGAITLPNTDGTANQVLTTDGAGTVTWQSETITLATLKTEVAASTDFADFQTRIAGL